MRLENAMQAGTQAFHDVCRDLDIETQEQVDRLRRTAWRYAPEQHQRAKFGYDLGNIAQMQLNVYQQLAMGQCRYCGSPLQAKK